MKDRGKSVSIFLKVNHTVEHNAISDWHGAILSIVRYLASDCDHCAIFSWCEYRDGLF